MIKFKRVIIVLSSLIVLACQTTEEVRVSSIIFKNVNVITMTNNTVLEDQSVYISNGIIRYIGDFDKIIVPEGCQIVNGAGKYLMPGFSDMHVHTYDKNDLSLFLANGVTKVRHMSGSKRHIKKREKIKKGEILGPELFTASPIVDGKDPIWPRSYVISDSKKVEKSIKELKQKGYNFIKVYEMLSNEVFLKILDEAKKTVYR